MNSHTEDIANAEPATTSLLERGVLEEGWVASFLSMPQTSADGSTWPARRFRLEHFVSMYLPLRYEVWKQNSGRRNPETEKRLATLIAVVEERLWLSAAVAPWPSGVERDLIVLVLGDGTPLRLGVDALHKWEEKYIDLLGELSSSWRGMPGWSRWTAMALHFASFYLDVALTRNVPGREPPSGAVGAKLTERVSECLSVETVQLIELWLASVAAERDAAGTPVVGTENAEGRKLKVRTRTEFLLLG